MRIVWSPLVGSASGKTAGLVASSWKGRQYIRKLIVPHNPQTAAQTAVRESLARCVELWRSLHTDIKAWLDTYGVDYRMAGYNVFISKSRANEQVPEPMPVVPDHPHHDAVLDFAAVVGIGASGDIDVSWTKEDPTALSHIAIFARELTTNRFSALVTEVDATEAATLTGLTAGADHDVYAFYTDTTTKVCGTTVCIEDVASKA